MGAERRRNRANLTDRIVGSVRFAILLLWVAVAGTTVVLCSYLPIRIRGTHLSALILTRATRVIVALLGVGVDVAPAVASTIRTHEGFLFPNHVSFCDIALMASFAPMRFLASAAVAKTPIVGSVARAIDTQFVDRADPESRQRSRDALAASPPTPPIVIFPEGGIPVEPVIWPLRHGAFEVAAETGREVQMVGIAYSTPAARWSVGGMVPAVWAMCCLPRPLSVSITCGPRFRSEELAGDGRVRAAELGRQFFADTLGLPFGEPDPGLAVLPQSG